MNQNLHLVGYDDAIAAAVRLHLEEAAYRVQRQADGVQA